MLRGELVMEGTPKDAVNRYVGFVLDRSERHGRPSAVQGASPAATSSFRHGDGASRILDVQMLNTAPPSTAASFRPGESHDHPCSGHLPATRRRTRWWESSFATASAWMSSEPIPAWSGVQLGDPSQRGETLRSNSSWIVCSAAKTTRSLSPRNIGMALARTGWTMCRLPGHRYQGRGGRAQLERSSALSKIRPRLAAESSGVIRDDLRQS